MTNFLIDWLLCSVAFSTLHVPADVIGVARIAAAGVLVAIAIAFQGLALPGPLH